MRDQKKWGKSLLRAVLLTVVLAALTIGMMGCGETPTLLSSSDGTKTDGKTENSVFGVGDTVELGDTVVRFVGITESNGSAYNKPEDGMVYLLCEFEIANNGEDELNVSSMMSFETYCDDYSCSISFGALTEKGNKEQLDGTVAAGKKMNGVVGYEVTAEWEELEIHYTPDLLSGKEIVFKATNS